MELGQARTPAMIGHAEGRSAGWPRTVLGKSNPAMQFDFAGAPERTRTPNLLIRSQTLYPIELRARETWIIAAAVGYCQPS